MNNGELRNRQKIIFKQCLNAVINGPFIPGWEFHPLFGLHKSEIVSILNEWADIDLDNQKVQLAINNALNNLIGYPINSPERWNEFISISKNELSEMFEEWIKTDRKI